mmetsp:Transcript_14646/g.37931  ORF Transcript_14646/g.37931 Transcript_14646/m.37931 type:complete len:81 (-) Transcript_14646:72-314(-)
MDVKRHCCLSLPAQVQIGPRLTVFVDVSAFSFQLDCFKHAPFCRLRTNTAQCGASVASNSMLGPITKAQRVTDDGSMSSH